MEEPAKVSIQELWLLQGCDVLQLKTGCLSILFPSDLYILIWFEDVAVVFGPRSSQLHRHGITLKLVWQLYHLVF